MTGARVHLARLVDRLDLTPAELVAVTLGTPLLVWLGRATGATAWLLDRFA